MAEWCARCGVAIWAYCLMPNHVHLVAVPTASDGLRRAIGEAHRRYTRHVNFRQQWRGHLWQDRFASFPLDQTHLLAAVRYVELNPVRARLVTLPHDYPWSSARAHLHWAADPLVKAGVMTELVPDWSTFLSGGLPDEALETMRRHERTGRPLGSEAFVERIEEQFQRTLKPQKAGRKPAMTSQTG